MKNNIFIVLGITISLFSCNNEYSEQIQLESENTIQLFYLIDSLKSGPFIELDKHSKDTIRKGFFSKGQRFGCWEYLDEKGNTRLKEEYLIIDGKSFLNQKWLYLNIRDSIGEFYFSKNNTDSTLELKIEKPLHNRIDSVEYYISKIIIGNFDKEYTNINTSSADTLLMKKNIGRINLNNLPINYKRGYIVEQVLIPYGVGKKGIVTKNMYFEVN